MKVLRRILHLLKGTKHRLNYKATMFMRMKRTGPVSNYRKQKQRKTRDMESYEKVNLKGLAV
jgi:hypothetical protein